MPAYPGSNLAKLLHNNVQGFLWDNEIPVVGTLSKAYILERINRSFYPWGLSFEATFSGNPGAFEIDLMGANNDQLINYNFLGSIVQTNNLYGTIFTGYVGRWDMPTQMWPRYVAGYMKTLTNAVNLTLTVTK
jgi:hypothetical protein